MDVHRSWVKNKAPELDVNWNSKIFTVASRIEWAVIEEQREKERGEQAYDSRRKTTAEIQKSIVGRLGKEITDKLPSEVIEPLSTAEQYYRLGEEPRQAIVDFYDAVACCLQHYVGAKINHSLSVYQYAELFSKIDEPAEHVKNVFLKSIWSSITNSFAQVFPDLDRNALNTHAKRLIEIQKLRNPHAHREGDVIPGPPSSREQWSDCDNMRNLVLGSEQSPSVIVDIIKLFG